MSRSETSAQGVLSSIHASYISASAASVSALSMALNPPVLPGVKANYDTIDCALDPQHHPDPWPTDSNFFWLTTNYLNFDDVCNHLQNNKVVLGPASDKNAIAGTYYEIYAGTAGEAAMYNHSITLAVAWDSAGCAITSKPYLVDFVSYGVLKCRYAFQTPATNCKSLLLLYLSARDANTQSPLGDPWASAQVHQDDLTHPPGLYANFSSIGGVYWQDCIRWMVFSLPQPLDSSFAPLHPSSVG